MAPKAAAKPAAGKKEKAGTCCAPRPAPPRRLPVRFELELTRSDSNAWICNR